MIVLEYDRVGTTVRINRRRVVPAKAEGIQEVTVAR